MSLLDANRYSDESQDPIEEPQSLATSKEGEETSESHPSVEQEGIAKKSLLGVESTENETNVLQEESANEEFGHETSESCRATSNLEMLPFYHLFHSVLATLDEHDEGDEEGSPEAEENADTNSNSTTYF